MTDEQAKLPPLVAVKHAPIVDQEMDAPLAALPVTHIGSMIELAINKGVSPDDMGKIYELYKEERKWDAETAFNAALVRFHQECPPIVRRTQNEQFKVKRNGVMVPSRYASMQDIEDKTEKPLGQNGLSYTFGDCVVEDNQMTMTFLLSHVGGHTRTSKMTFPVAASAGAEKSRQSAMQVYGGTVSYLKRYLVSAGLALKNCDEPDNDGNDPEQPPELITLEQVRHLIDFTVRVKASLPKFLEFMEVKQISDIRASDFYRATKALAEKEAENKAKR